MTTSYIRPSALCLIRRGNQILVYIGTDTVKGKQYARPLGGGIEFFEHSSEAVKREMMEETGQLIESPQFLEVIENRFWLEGRQHHQIMFLYEAKFSDASIYEKDILTCMEGPQSFKALWLSLEEMEERNVRLVPPGIAKYLDN